MRGQLVRHAVSDGSQLIEAEASLVRRKFFRDRLGAIDQQVMAMATTGWLVVAGRAIDVLPISVAVPES